MADFCQQCSIEQFGEDFHNLANLGPPLSPGKGYIVICEGCGATFVDHEGRCISPDCDYRHGKENR